MREPAELEPKPALPEVQGVVRWPQMHRIAEAAGNRFIEAEKLVADLQREIATLRSRVVELEQRSARYRGEFRSEDAPYFPGDLATHSGQLWHCWEETDAKPGTSDHWQRKKVADERLAACCRLHDDRG